MAKSKHIQKRMSDRGITQSMLEIVCKFGVDQQDKIILNKKNSLALLEHIREMERVVKKLLDKGGLVVVEKEGVLITTYNLPSRGDFYE